MPMQRPIVFYENLMHTYDNQVAELLAAKTTYILLSSNQDNEIDSLDVVDKKSEAQPIAAEIIQPNVKKVVPKKSTKREKAPKKVKQPKAIKTGLGLSLDDILSEEDSVAARDHNQYFND